MADDETKPAEHQPQQHPAQKKAAPPAAKAVAKKNEATQESEAVKTDNENYVGVDPIYQQSAYEEPLEPDEAHVPEDATDEEQEAAEAAFEAEQAVLESVKANEAGSVVETEEPVPFEEWVGDQASTVAKSRTPGANSDAAEEDMAATEEAKGDDGKIAPHSTSLHQPGVNRV